MPQIDLFLKSGLEVNVKVVPNPVTYTVGVRGWKTGQFIILDHPSAGMDLARISRDAQCHLRYISEGKVTSFASQGVTILKNPLNIYIIEYPKTIHSQISLRKTERVKASVPVVIKEPGSASDAENNAFTRGMILDISFGGLLFSTHKDLPLDKEITFDFEFITERGIKNLRAKVKNKRLDWKSFDFPYLHGCEFVEIKQEERKVFQNFFEYCYKLRDNLRAKELAKGKAKPSEKKGNGTFY